MESVAIFGLGLMGRPMAASLLRAGFSVRGWNRSPMDPARVPGVLLHASPEAAARADLCLLVLSDSPAVDAVLAQIEPQLRAGQLVIDLGTSDPARSRAHAARLAGRGVGWVDAPVSGGPGGAAAGDLAVMCGASEADFARARPALQALGRPTLVGGPGAGHTTKIVNQLIVALAIEAVAEAVALAESAGVDPALVQKALAGGFADSKILQIHGSRMIARDYAPGGKAATQLKDLRLAQGLAAAAGLELPHLEDTAARFARLVALGHGDLDHSALHMLVGGEGAA
ncbi:NAD(P)-dependent oxidoreductase [Oscillochloris sp. ZM17-4]|uniref:NAD(P)-dependent oxidoreductase n=1 Tax=Oscillochloris sp. ZM17-4 TaxID=2866714 RepID=UPI001C72DA10|nr:NAD(P)-dependent oxidoreductase [Oscillochloris sp. ZM17-4]MBX0326595.1 NAD(P)-dependent oxidoreductase [Oscillochloris sp. ZM17-4]